MKNILLFIFILIIISCQNKQSNFVITDFQNGLPQEIKFTWENTFFTQIEGGDYFKKIYLISRDSLKSENNLAIAPIQLNGNFSFFRINFEKIDDNLFRSAINLNTENEDLLSKLILQIDLEQKQLKYKWENTDSANIKYPTIIQEYKLKVGKTFPIVKIETQEGNWTNENNNKIILINWWATSCIPCIEEIPGLNKLVEKYKNESVEFLSIIWDAENLDKFLSKHKFNYLHGYSSEYLTSLLGETFPRNIIINRNGDILYNKLGATKDTHLELDKIISKYL
ncbi:MAG: TlpA family protein disulfide reductase [Ignavibacteriae bacterium]|nr:TlpA family protein disulfide reductase [Ignavibacteriota bacterium]